MSGKARDELIANRARRHSEVSETRKPVMVIDAENIPHGFIVGALTESQLSILTNTQSDHSERMAEKAKAMIDDLRKADWEAFCNKEYRKEQASIARC